MRWQSALLLPLLLALVGCGSQGSQPSSSPSAPQASAASASSSGTQVTASRASAATQPNGTLVVFGAGTLASPFKDVQAAFTSAHPGVTVQPQFGGSVKMAKQVTELNQPADVVAVADYNVIPQEMFGQGGKKRFASWYAGFASNAITFVYTPKSKGADTITVDNWYKVLSQPGVQIGRSNPDTDPSGYQLLQMLKLAETYYHQPGLSDAILKNAPETNMRDTETELLSALKVGQIDYLAIYRSDAQQNSLQYLQLPPQIDLSDAKYSADYAKAMVTTKSGQLQGKPIVYAVTVPDNAPNPALGRAFVSLLIGKDGEAIMQKHGFVPVAPAYANDVSAIPADLASLMRPWPAS